MISRWIILSTQLIGTLLIVAAFTSGVFAVFAFILAAIFSPIQSVAAAFAERGVRIIAFVMAALPSALMVFALVQRPKWQGQCAADGCSGLAEGTLIALPWLAFSTFAPFIICLWSLRWNGLGVSSGLNRSTRIAVICASFAPLVLGYGVRSL